MNSRKDDIMINPETMENNHSSGIDKMEWGSGFYDFGFRRIEKRLGGIAILDMMALWFYMAGGRFSNTFLLLAGLFSLAILPVGVRQSVVHRSTFLLLSSGVFLFFWAMNRESDSALPLFCMSIQIVFSMGFAGLSGYCQSRMAGHGRILKSVIWFLLVLSFWSVFYAFKIMPQHQLFGEAGSGSQEILENIGGIFYVGNNYYTLTYYVLAPMAAAVACVFYRMERKSLALLLSGIVCLGLSMMFGRRTPVVCCGVTWLVFVVVVVMQSPQRIRTAIRMSWKIGMLWLLVSMYLRWESTTWVYDGFSDRFSAISQDARFELWKGALIAIYNNPWGGVASSIGISRYAHNAVLDVALSIGIGGAFLFAVMIFYVAGRVVFGWMKNGSKAGLLEHILVSMVISHMVSMMSEPFLPIRISVFIWAGVTWMWLYERRVHPPAGHLP